MAPVFVLVFYKCDDCSLTPFPASACPTGIPLTRGRRGVLAPGRLQSPLHGPLRLLVNRMVGLALRIDPGWSGDWRLHWLQLVLTRKANTLYVQTGLLPRIQIDRPFLIAKTGYHEMQENMAFPPIFISCRQFSAWELEKHFFCSEKNMVYKLNYYSFLFDSCSKGRDFQGMSLMTQKASMLPWLLNKALKLLHGSMPSPSVCTCGAFSCDP